MLEHDEAGRLMASLRDGQEAAHLLAPDGRFVEHLNAQRRVALGERARLLGEVDRSTDVRRKVGQVALHASRGGNGFAMLQAARCRLHARLADGAGEHSLQRRRPGIWTTTTWAGRSPRSWAPHSTAPMT